VPAKPLNDAALLFRAFGEQYHERQLEEDHVFPMVERGKGDAARYAPILKAQHDRGRAITDYLVAATRGGTIAPAARAPLAKAMDSFVWMYRRHTAIEDTVVFPAWKETMSGHEYEELSDKFEELEQKMFAKDGYEEAVKRIAAVEGDLGLSDLASFTAPPPPNAK
jgi:hemerythrin-like domain-containing protein